MILESEIEIGEIYKYICHSYSIFYFRVLKKCNETPYKRYRLFKCKVLYSKNDWTIFKAGSIFNITSLELNRVHKVSKFDLDYLMVEAL